MIYGSSTDHGFPKSVSPTITPSAPVYSRFSWMSSQPRTFPLLIIGIFMWSLRRLTCSRSADPCLRRCEDTVRACRVIQAAPHASRRCAKSSVFVEGWQSLNFADTGTAKECDIEVTVSLFTSGSGHDQRGRFTYRGSPLMANPSARGDTRRNGRLVQLLGDNQDSSLFPFARGTVHI